MDKIHKTLLIGINLGDHGSTGNIMRNSFEYAHEHGDFDFLVCVPKDEGKSNTYVYKYRFNIFKRFVYYHLLKIKNKYPDGYLYKEYSKRILKKIKKETKRYDNVIVHLHNLHMADIHFPTLFKGLSKMNIKVIYTLHDEWAFTGGCYCFMNCNKWREGCKYKCPQGYDKKTISAEKNFKIKEKYTTLFRKDQLVVVPVSNWLKEEASKSFLSKYEMIVNNGETPLEALDNPDLELKKNLGLDSKKIVLTVSSYWDEWKGPQYLYGIAEKLPRDYVLLIVGGKFDIKNYKNIVHINTVTAEELARYYSIADVYVSTSQSESLGLTTCEAQLSGVPVVCFGHTAIKETVTEKSGIVVGEDNNVEKMVESIIYAVEKKPFKKEDIIESGNRFKKYSSAKRYLDLYNDLSK